MPIISPHSLLCKLLALKADDEGTDPELLIREICQAAFEMKDELTNDQLLLIGQWTKFYKKIPDKALEKIRKEVRMQPIETTISEHIFNQGEAKGIVKGITKGKAEGQVEGQIAMLESLFRKGILSKEQTEKMLIPLRRKLKKIKPGNN